MEQKSLDEICNVAFMGLFSIAREHGFLCLSELNLEDKSHLCIVKIATMIESVGGMDLYMKTSFFNWLKLKKIFNYKFKREKRKMNHQCTVVDCYIDTITHTFKDKYCLERVYENFYEVK